MQIRKLHELAKTIRSKNAGVDRITFDIIFRDPFSGCSVGVPRAIERK